MVSDSALTWTPEPDADPPTVGVLLQEITDLRAALATRDMIGQAKGIIRILLRCDAETAFTVLAQISQDTNHRLADVAMLLSESSAAGQPLPPPIRASWQRRTRHLPPLDHNNTAMNAMNAPDDDAAGSSSLGTG